MKCSTHVTQVTHVSACLAVGSGATSRPRATNEKTNNSLKPGSAAVKTRAVVFQTAGFPTQKVDVCWRHLT